MKLEILNLGAGVQSTALYLLYMDGVVQPRLDHAIFADTGDEPQAVYRHLEWLKSLGGPPIHIASVGYRLSEMLLADNGRFASIPAHVVMPDGTKTIGRRQCTKEFKVRPIERYIRCNILGRRPKQRAPKGTEVTQVFGISLDEARRAQKIKERLASSRWVKPRFPLIEMRWTRADCVNYLASKNIPHAVSKSACVFCPYRSRAEWKHIKETDPEGWKLAVRIDEALRQHKRVSRGMIGSQYLFRGFVPLKDADFGQPSEQEKQLAFNWALECDGMCGV